MDREKIRRKLRILLMECELVYLSGRDMKEVEALAMIFANDLWPELARFGGDDAAARALETAFAAHRRQCGKFPTVRDILERLPAAPVQFELKVNGVKTSGFGRVIYMARRGDAEAIRMVTGRSGGGNG